MNSNCNRLLTCLLTAMHLSLVLLSALLAVASEHEGETVHKQPGDPAPRLRVQSCHQALPKKVSFKQFITGMSKKFVLRMIKCGLA